MQRRFLFQTLILTALLILTLTSCSYMDILKRTVGEHTDTSQTKSGLSDQEKNGSSSVNGSWNGDVNRNFDVVEPRPSLSLDESQYKSLRVFKLPQEIIPYSIQDFDRTTNTLLFIDSSDPKAISVASYALESGQVKKQFSSVGSNNSIDGIRCNDLWVTWIEFNNVQDKANSVWSLYGKNRKTEEVKTIKQVKYSTFSTINLYKAVEFLPDSCRLVDDQIYCIYPLVENDSLYSVVSCIDLDSGEETVLAKERFDKERYASLSIDQSTNKTIIWSGLSEINDHPYPLTYYKYSDIFTYDRETKNVDKITDGLFVASPQMHQGVYYGLMFDRVSNTSMENRPKVVRLDVEDHKIEIIDDDKSVYRSSHNPHYSIGRLFSNDRFLGWWESAGYPVLYDYEKNRFDQFFEMPKDKKSGIIIIRIFEQYVLITDANDQTKTYVIDLSKLE